MATQAQIQSILDYFGSDSSIYRKIVLGTATDQEISYAFTQIPQMQADVSASGTILGWKYADPVYIVPHAPDDIVGSVDSNGVSTGYGGGSSTNYPISFGRDPETGQAYIESGKNAVGSTIAAVADRASLAVTGVNIGAKLGKAIDQTLYDLAPEWWDEHYPTINPDTWPTICGENKTGEKFFRTLFNINDNGDTTAYINEKVVAQTYQMLRDMGLWEPKETPEYANPGSIRRNDRIYNSDFRRLSLMELANNIVGVPVTIDTVKDSGVLAVYNAYMNHTGFFSSYHGNLSVSYSQSGDVDFSSSGPYTVTNDYTVIKSISPTFSLNRNANKEFQFNRNTQKWENASTAGPNNYSVAIQPIANSSQYYIVKTTFKQESGIQGFSDISGAPQYPPTNITGTTVNDVLQQLKQEYPDLFLDPITEEVLQPDGTIETETYVPIPWQIDDPEDKTQTSPVTQPDPSTSTLVDPEVAPQIVTQTEPSKLDDSPVPPVPDTPDTGTGTIDPAPIPVGQASSLWAIYNPTQAQLNSFGGWLWSSNFVEQLKKLFNDPMQAIIGVHKVFATPNTGAPQTIVCGYLDSGVASRVVTSQYTDVDCGTVNLREYFGNVFDYEPYTSVKLFLPFIGIVPLDVSYIMRSSITVKYRVDVLSGACIANVSVKRDGAGGVLFTYAGSAIVSYPISSGSYMGLVTGAVSTIAGIARGSVMGTIAGLSRTHTDVQHSGQFTGAAGAMGGKKPYLIISRPQTHMAHNVEHYQGKPANATLTLSDCHGFTRVTEVHLKIPNAFDEEITEIQQLLEQGVLID